MGSRVEPAVSMGQDTEWGRPLAICEAGKKMPLWSLCFPSNFPREWVPPPALYADLQSAESACTHGVCGLFPEAQRQITNSREQARASGDGSSVGRRGAGAQDHQGAQGDDLSVKVGSVNAVIQISAGSSARGHK